MKAHILIQKLRDAEKQAEVKSAIQKNRAVQKKQLARVYNQIANSKYGTTGIKELF